MLRLGFHYHLPASRVGKEIHMPAVQGRFLDALAVNLEHLVCFLHSPASHEAESIDYGIRCSNVSVVDLGPHNSVPRRLMRCRSIHRLVRTESSRMDLLLARAPTPMLATVSRGAKPVQTSLLVVGDSIACLADSRQPMLRRLAIWLMTRWQRLQQDKIAENSLVFVNSSELFQQMKGSVSELERTKTTTLTKGDFYQRQDTCRLPCIRILFVGRIVGGKGVLEIVESVGQLVTQGRNVTLDLVGWVEKGDNVLLQAMEFARQRGFDQRIQFHGRVPAGPELYRFYREADIFVVASRSTEGFPRTVWEAMANSLPVIATKVGGIAEMCGDAVLLIEPKSSSAITEAVLRLLESETLRMGMIVKARALAKTATLEEQATIMVNRLEEWVRRRRRA